MSKGLFVTFEGGEGCGKSTVSKLVLAKLTDLGIDTILTREPGGTPIAEQIRDIILNPDNKGLTARTEALLFAASRAQHWEEKIAPAIGAGKVVLCDRWLSSSIAYQGVGRGLGINEIEFINDFGIDGNRADIEFFIDVPPEIGFERIKNRNGFDRMEQEEMDFHKSIYRYFRKSALLEENVVSINGLLTPDEIADEVVKKIVNALRD